MQNSDDEEEFKGNASTIDLISENFMAFSKLLVQEFSKPQPSQFDNQELRPFG